MATVLFESGADKQSTVYLEEKVLGDVAPLTNTVNPEDHGVDIAEDFGSGDVAWSIVKPASNFRVEESSCSDVESLDARRGDCLGAKQDSRERLGVHETRP